MTLNLILFLILAIVAVASGLGLIFSRNAVYAALLLIVNFVTIAIFYLLLNAPFISISQVTVYAGAIMVLFLFVIMLLGAEQTGRTEERWWFQPVALFLGVVLLIESGFIVFTQRASFVLPGAVNASFGGPQPVGEMLFSQYLLPFEATSILLLAAMIGAIVLTHSDKK